jgi:hypothetical protein
MLRSWVTLRARDNMAGGGACVQEAQPAAQLAVQGPVWEV